MLADFGWNCFGGAPFDTLCLRRGEIDNALAEHFDLPLKKAAVNMEGGALEVNNTVILAFKEMVEHRNPDIPLDEIEKMLLDTYGKQKMIWIDEKLLLEQPGHKVENFFGQGANGHIDDYMRFVNDSTILVGVMDPSEKDNNPINKIDFDRLQRNLTQIKQATNLDGKPFHIVEIPMPDVTHYAWKGPLPQHRKMANPEIYKNIGAGETIVEVPVMSYLNFTISNGVVLIHRYWQEGIPDSEKKKDAFVYKTMQHFFPNRKIIQINALPLNWNGGGIHCATQQVPQLNSDGLD